MLGILSGPNSNSVGLDNRQVAGERVQNGLLMEELLHHGENERSAGMFGRANHHDP